MILIHFFLILHVLYLGRVDFPPEMNTQFTFSPTISQTCTNVTVYDDNEVEDTEVFEVSLSSSFDDVIFLPSTAIVVIVDNDQGE